MSVQRVVSSNTIETTCPIVVNSSEAIFSYQMASSVLVDKNVNGRPECYPNDYAYLQVYSAQNAKKCCENNAYKMNVSNGLSMYR